METAPRLAVAFALLLPAAFGVVQASKWTRAELLARRDSVEALESASRLVPSNAQYRARIAVLDASREDSLDAALSRNAWNPSWWILKSVRQEEDGDVAGAENSLLRANQVSQYYIPRWSLAAFYYRQGNRAKFEPWARSALAAGYGASDSIFRMAQRLGFSSDEVLRSIIGDNPQRTAEYVFLTLHDGNLDTAGRAAARLVADSSKPSLDAVLDVCDALFRGGEVAAAADLWDRLVAAKRVDVGAVDPANGKTLATTAPGRPSIERAFDWRHADVDGVTRSASDGDDSLRLEFSGRQPESCDLFSEYVVLQPGSRYRATIRYRLDGIARGAGLRIGVRPLDPAKPALLSGLLEQPAADFEDQAFEFQAPPQPDPLKLLISYTRTTGTTRIEGRLWIQSVKVEPIP